jgi:hypothetical protein
MSMRRQARIRTVVSVPRRVRLASILVMLLTGILLLGTSAFGGFGGAIEAIECLPPWPCGRVPDKCRKYFGTPQEAPAAGGDCLPKAPEVGAGHVKFKTWTVKAQNCMEATNAKFPGREGPGNTHTKLEKRKK